MEGIWRGEEGFETSDGEASSFLEGETWELPCDWDGESCSPVDKEPWEALEDLNGDEKDEVLDLALGLRV